MHAMTHRKNRMRKARFPLSYFAAAGEIFASEKCIASCSFVPSEKGQTEDENFQRLDRQNKYVK